MQKQMQALLLTALMVWTLAAPALGTNPFFDVPEDHWAYDSISYLAAAGLVEGYPDGTFGGSRNFTRYEMAMVFARIVAQFEKHIQELVEQGIESRSEGLADQVRAAIEEASKALEEAAGARKAAADAQGVAAGAQRAAEAAQGTASAAQGAADEAARVARQAQAAADAANAAIEELQRALAAVEGRTDALAEQLAAVQKLSEAAQAVAGSAVTTDDDLVAQLERALNAAILAEQAAAEAQRIASAAASRGDEALRTANAAMRAAEAAQSAAREAASTAREALATVEARSAEALAKSNEALSKADEALALARRLAAPVAQETTPVAPAPGGAAVPATAAPAFVFTDEARAAIEEIATAIVTEQLRDVKANADRISGEVQSLRTDLNAAEALIRSEATRLEKAIADLTAEFRSELEILGVRVTRLESMFATLESDVQANTAEIRAIRADMDRVSISGFNESSITGGRQTGSGTPLVDPRDEDSDEFDVPANRVANRTYLVMEANPSDDAVIRGVADLVVDQRILSGGVRPILEESRLFAEVETPHPVGYARLGSLDAADVASKFTPYILDAEVYGEAHNVGAFAEVRIVDATHSVFGSHSVEGRDTVAGFTSHYQLNDEMDFSASVVRLLDGGNTRTGVAFGSTGSMDELTYNALLVRDVEQDASLYDVTVAFDVLSATIQAQLERIDGVWSDADAKLPFAERIKTEAEDDKAGDESLIDRAIYADQGRWKLRADLPVMNFNAFVQAGRYDTSLEQGEFQQFTGYGVYNLDLFGLDVTAQRENFLNQLDETRANQRIAVSTKVEEMDVMLTLYRQEDQQSTADPGEDLQNHFMVNLARPVQIFVPWVASAQFGSSFTAQNQSHSEYKLALEGYELLPAVSIGAELAAVNNVLTDGKWLPNANWSGENETRRVLEATWSVTDFVSVLGGYKVVDNDHVGVTVTQDAGLRYQLEAFGGDLAFGYGYRLVKVDGTVDGSGRSTIDAGFTKQVGGFTLDAKGKHVIGGTAGEAGNEYDTVAALQLIYPVYSGANFTLDGKYVRSAGDKLDRDEYSASSLTAGLRINF